MALDAAPYGPSGEIVSLSVFAARVARILATPGIEWPVIAAETTDALTIYVRYAAPLAAIGAVALFIGQTVIGTVVPLLGRVRVSFVDGLVAALLTLAFALLSVYVLAWVVDALAEKFGGQRDRLRALKLVAYSYTPAWLAGALQIVPPIGPFALLAFAYCPVLLYWGLPELMRCPKAQAPAYSAIVLVCAATLFFGFIGFTMWAVGTGPSFFD